MFSDKCTAPPCVLPAAGAISLGALSPVTVTWNPRIDHIAPSHYPLSWLPLTSAWTHPSTSLFSPTCSQRSFTHTPKWKSSIRFSGVPLHLGPSPKCFPSRRAPHRLAIQEPSLNTLRCLWARKYKYQADWSKDVPHSLRYSSKNWPSRCLTLGGCLSWGFHAVH